LEGDEGVPLVNEHQSKGAMLGYDIDLGQVFARLYARKILILSFLFAAVLLAASYLRLAEYTYTATLVVSPAASSTDSLPNSLRGLNGLASIAGINLGAGMGTQSFMLYQEGLYSRDVADELSRDPEIMHAAFYKKWDEATRNWIQPSGLLFALARDAKAAIGLPNPPWHAPDGQLLQEYIGDNVDVESDPEKPVVTITFHHRNPQFAAKFLAALDRAVDEKLRYNALQRANEYIAYLSDALTKTTNADIRESLLTALSDQEKTRMMASASPPFAAQPFGMPSTSRNPTNPRPLLVLAAGILMGAVLGVLAALWLPPQSVSRRVRKPVAAPTFHAGG
jgi:uncharacterized protein involved in exopolysaccharide biosynthesis